MAKTLVAHEQPIQKVFSEEYAFYIPEYQRPYAWTVEQATELLEDLLGYIQSNPGQIAEMPAYFLGSIVLIKSDTPESDVVDGQQRLTTLTLLLSAIRANTTGKVRDLITKRLHEEGDILAGNAERFRLTLRQRDAEFFQRYVQRDGGFGDLLALEGDINDSRRNLRGNARFFQHRLEKMSEQDRVDLASFILQRCYLVVVSTPDQNSAYRIFSVLNSRGLDLSATDILKAKVIGAIPEAQREAYTKKWEDAEEELGREDFNTLFGHIRTVSRKTKAKETLLKEFEEHVPIVMMPIKFIDDLLIPMAEAYGEISTSSYVASSHSGIVNEHLKWLNRLDFNDWVPPALAFLVRHRNEAALVAAFMRDLERLAYYMLATSRGINDRIDRFGKVTAAVEAGADLHAASSPLQLTPPEQYAFYRRLDGPLYDELAAKARTPILLRIDSLLADGGATYEQAIISIEHVLPQSPKPGSKWLEWFPDPIVRAKTVHRIGNLALLSRRKNSAASNLDFERKKDTYFRRGGVAPFVLTTQVLNVAEWLPSVVAQRQEKLMSLLESHWRLNNRKTETEWILETI